MDEADTYLGPNAARQHEELRGFVNAGHRRGAKAYRCVGEPAKIRVEAFPAYCAWRSPPSATSPTPSSTGPSSCGCGDVLQVSTRAVPLPPRNARRAPSCAPGSPTGPSAPQGWSMPNRRCRGDQPTGQPTCGRRYWRSPTSPAATGRYGPGPPASNSTPTGGPTCLRRPSARDVRDVFPEPTNSLRPTWCAGCAPSRADRGRRCAVARSTRPGWPVGYVPTTSTRQRPLRRQTLRGYLRADFADAWERYPPAAPPSPVGVQGVQEG